MRSEHETRHIPWSPVEASYARNRDPNERTTVRPNDRVWYRRNNWDPVPVLATVLQVQDLEQRDDPNLWHAVKDSRGRQIYQGDGTPLYAPVADPWPWVLLAPDDMPGRTAQTWEARLRGSAGWLPLDWQDRHVRLPGEVLLRPLAPLNTDPANIR